MKIHLLDSVLFVFPPWSEIVADCTTGKQCDSGCCARQVCFSVIPLAARLLLYQTVAHLNYGVKKVVIFDIDLHHGLWFLQVSY